MSRDELVGLVSKIVNAGGEATEAQVDAWVLLFERSVPHPEASDLIYWSQRYGLGDDPSVDEIVDAALGYRPIAL